MYTALPFAPSTLIAAQPGCTTCNGSSAGVGSGSGSGGPGSGSGGGGTSGPGGAGPGYPPGTYPLGGGLVYVPGVGVVSADELPGLTEAPLAGGGSGGDTTARKRGPLDLFWILAVLALVTGLAIGRKGKRT